MAPTTEAAANSAYSLAVNRLVTICNDLDGHLPPFDIQEDDNYDPSLPSVWPRPRLESTTDCAQCVEELDQLSAGARDSHICRHNRDHDESTDTRTAPTQRRSVRRRQPNAGVIRQDIIILDERFEAFTAALAALAAILPRERAIEFEEHLLVWGDYRRWLKDRALTTIDMLEPAPVPQSQAMVEQQHTHTTVTTPAAAPSSSPLHVTGSSDGLPVATTAGLPGTIAEPSFRLSHRSNLLGLVHC